VAENFPLQESGRAAGPKLSADVAQIHCRNRLHPSGSSDTHSSPEQPHPMLARRLVLSHRAIRPTTAPPIRAMSSAAAKPKLEWLVMIPDKPNALERRLQIRP
jgi:hypothetical protein